MFPEKHLACWICQWFKFSSPLYFQLYHQVLLFYEGIYFTEHCAMVTSINYYVTDGHFIKSSILKPIIESKTQGTNILWVKKEKTILNFKDKNSLTLPCL